MAKHTAHLHIGPAVPGVLAPHAVLRDDAYLAGCGVVVPPVAQAGMDRADIEIRRRHKAVGLRRRDVEGAWAEVCRAAFRARSDVLISQPGFVEADFHQVALALDGLVGLELHLLVTPAEPVGTGDLGRLLGPWARFVRKPGRVHVLPVGRGSSPDRLGAQVAQLLLTDRGSELDQRLVGLERRRLRIRERLARAGIPA
jgi:hypothetical protein